MGHTADDSQLALVHGPCFELGNLGKKARYYDYEITYIGLSIHIYEYSIKQSTHIFRTYQLVFYFYFLAAF